VDALTTEELLELPWSEVEEHLKGLVKDGRLAQLASSIRNLGEDLCIKRPKVEDLGSRIPLILGCVPRDTQSVYGVAIKEFKENLNSVKADELSSYFTSLDNAIANGPMAKEWFKLAQASADLKMK
jgi:hypothetical protein